MADNLQQTIRSKMIPSLRQEMTQYAIVSLYLFVFFGTIILYKASILRQVGVHYVPYGFAIIKALIIGKFILLGNAMQLGERSRNMPLLLHVLHKVIVFALLLIVLSVAEEVAAGLIHGHSIGDTFARFAHETWLQVLATCLLLCLVLTPFFTLRAIGQTIGWERLRQMFLGEKGLRQSLR